MTDWLDFAACLGMDSDVFVIDGLGYLSTADRERKERKAKAICADCTVAAECLDWAMDTYTHLGIFGGMTGEERQRLRKRHSARMWKRRQREAST